jgi:tripartite-type tricarboxylate transporter receptor subunit TctC
MTIKHCAFAAAILSGLFVGAHSANADSAEEFYTGRQITLWVSASAGGVYAVNGLALAPFIAAHLPGNPDIVVDYMTGAGGLRAMNYIYSNAPKDGSVIALIQSSVPYSPLYGTAAADFDPMKMNFLGSLNSTTGICVAWHESDVRTWEDLFDKDFFVGSSGAGSQMEIFPLMLNELFGTHITVISGYPGGNEVFNAMERGEVDGRCGSLISGIKSTRPTWFPEHLVYVPIQLAFERHPEFPDVPALGEFVTDERTRQVLELILSPMAAFSPLVAPPDVPPERVAALRAAFDAAMVDPAFLAEAERIGIEINPVGSDGIYEKLNRAYSMPPDVVEEAKAIMNLSGG